MKNKNGERKIKKYNGNMKNSERYLIKKKVGKYVLVVKEIKQ